MSRVIWVDNNVFSAENHKYRLRLEDEFSNIGFSFASSIFEAVNQVNSTVKTVLLVSGQMGKLLMPRIHHLKNVMVVLVFCFKTEEHKMWASNFKKVKAVANTFEDALLITKKLL
jgi:hypothetical protein